MRAIEKHPNSPLSANAIIMETHWHDAEGEGHKVRFTGEKMRLTDLYMAFKDRRKMYSYENKVYVQFKGKEEMSGYYKLEGYGIYMYFEGRKCEGIIRNSHFIDMGCGTYTHGFSFDLNKTE